jgi:hypothetical protein
LAGGGVVEFDVAGGVGGEGREERVDIGTVDSILGEGSVFTDVFEVILGSCVCDEVEEGKHRKERDGKREGIDGSHFDESIYNACLDERESEWRFRQEEGMMSGVQTQILAVSRDEVSAN